MPLPEEEGDATSCATSFKNLLIIQLPSAWVQNSGDDWSSLSIELESDEGATDVIYQLEYEIAFILSC